MRAVSNLFKEKIYGPERKTTARVSFEVLDLEAYNDVTRTVSGESLISRLSQSTNQIREMSNGYATFEPNYFKLDGSFHIPPQENEGDSELGWWSDVLSGDDGTFALPPVIEFNFTQAHSSMGLSVTFDANTNEYATDFLIECFDGLGALITSENVIGHTEPQYVLERAIEGYQRIVITINKWANPRRRARVVEVDFGVVREYSGEKLISLSVIEEMDLLASTVTSNEIKFVLDNSDNAFNILNPNGIYRFLRPNQKMSARIGLLIGEEKYEYIPMGKYFLDEWIVEEGAMTATFVGRDIFNILDATEYTNLLQNTNLYDLAVDVLNQANVQDFIIDEALKTMTTTGFTKKINTREALQMIAIAGRTAINQDRNGAIVLKHYEKLTFETGFMSFTGSDAYTGMVTPKVSEDYSFQAIDFETSYEIPRIQLAPSVTHLVFKVYETVDAEPVDVKFVHASVTEGQGFEINNPLINTQEHAAKVAEYMFREYDLIAEYQANWRQNPAFECGDIILIEDSFDSKKKARITKQEFNFSGYLDGMTEAKGGI